MNSSVENRIRQLAYQIWEAEGCPHGQDKRHWEMAKLLAISPSLNATTRTSVENGNSTVATPPKPKRNNKE